MFTQFLELMEKIVLDFNPSPLKKNCSENIVDLQLNVFSWKRELIMIRALNDWYFYIKYILITDNFLNM